MNKRLLLIINPYAGQKTGKKHLADILELFCTAGYLPTVCMTTGTGSACTLAREHAADYDLIVCVGGDGTFNETVSGLLASKADIPIGYIPCGSTNDFATSLKLSKNILTATKDIIHGFPTTFDIGVFNERHFTYVASFGAFTRASYATPQSLKNALGHLAYILEGIRDLGNIRPLHMRVETPERVFEDDYLFGAICNATSLGGILTLDPNTVDMNDGLLELLLIKYPSNAGELSKCILNLQEKTYDSKILTLHSTDRLTIHADAAIDWTLDGEHENGRETITIANLPNAYRLIKTQGEGK